MMKTFQLILLVLSIVLFNGKNSVLNNKVPTWNAELPSVQSFIENQGDLDDHELDGFASNTVLFIVTLSYDVISNQSHHAITTELYFTSHIRAPPVINV